MLRTLLAGTTAFALGPRLALAQADSAEARANLQAVKDYMIEHGDAMLERATTLEGQARGYYELVQSVGGDAGALSGEQGVQAATMIADMRQTWVEVHNNYEQVEGIVAGVPSLSDYDLILDAGVAEADGPDDVAPFDLTLPDGKVIARPGNLLHVNLETALWTTVPDIVVARVRTGDKEELLPDHVFLLGAAQGLKTYTGNMVADINAWEPNLTDAFTALVTMVPTAGDYFGEWKESRFVGGDLPIYVAQSRLVDVLGIMTSTQVMYSRGTSPSVADVDSSLDEQIKTGFDGLLAFIEDVHEREDAGETFAPEEADAIGSEAGDRAERITAQIALAASKLNVPIPI
ncbi:imelysin family protein [Marinivivus vitaminiproducens]|uniref:imelysin family protein n=1 Tax=Marinivivus vitaminiproducens TaxID=3035935 RepID=UPI0027A075FE|nr:imelysin family protein [Geminicoccaceae bacterium SCSIO 64248]